MYVLFITRGYPTSKYKGYGIFELDQAKALQRMGCKVVYAFVDVRSIRRWRKWGIERKNIDGVEIYGINIPLGRVPKSLLDKVSFWGLKYIYKRILKRYGKPDILHAHFTDCGCIAAALKKDTNIPLVITEHSSWINRDNIEENLYKRASQAYNSADILITVSHALADKIEKNFHIKSTYIPNIVDTDIFNYSNPPADGKFNFVSVGNLIYLKRMDLLIDAFKKAFSDNEDVTLTIFGDGPEKQKLQKMINEYHMEDRITLRGLCTRKEIAEQLFVSHCFVLASKSETFGVAYIEAMASGVPVIATRCGGPEEFVNHDNGIMVEVDDVDSLAAAMKYMYRNINKFDRDKISENTKSLFSPEGVGTKLLKVYRDILN